MGKGESFVKGDQKKSWKLIIEDYKAVFFKQGLKSYQNGYMETKTAFKP